MKTKNTKNNPHPEWLFGINPNAIEQQEAQGQQELVASQQLPRKCNYPRGLNATEQYHKMGIKTFTTSKGDELFIGVALPTGWKKEATPHSMWNNLVDDKARIRATFFYKAAFYDRDAFVNFCTRYSVNYNHVEGKDSDGLNKCFYTIVDAENKIELYKTEIGGYRNNEQLRQKCIDWLKSNYPDWEDINAYW